MYFLVEEKFSQTDDFTKSVATLVSQYHGVTFFELEEMTDFLHLFVSKVKALRWECAEKTIPTVRYIPKMISGSNWIDVTVLIDDIAICRIIKAKKEVSNG